MPCDILRFLAIWLAAAAGAFYDILTVVQKCHFLKTNQGVELIVEFEYICPKAENHSNEIKDRK